VGEIGNITGCEVDFPDPNNLMLFIANVTPSDGLYAGATFKFQVTIPPTYPYDPPKVECQTLVYHPNIDFEGHVCLNILRADWMPVLNLWAVLMGLVHLFRVLHLSKLVSKRASADLPPPLRASGAKPRRPSQQGRSTAHDRQTQRVREQCQTLSAGRLLYEQAVPQTEVVFAANVNPNFQFVPFNAQEFYGRQGQQLPIARSLRSS